MNPPRGPRNYDVFLSYHWRDLEQVERVARRLRDLGVTPFLDRWYLEPGRRWPEALEELLASCGSAAVFIGPEGLGSWQQREMYVALDRQSRDARFPVIPVILPGGEPPAGFLSLNTWIDLRSARLDESAAVEVLRLAVRGQAPTPDLLAMADAARATTCPYRGLRPFREEDASFFFGREDASDHLAQAVERSSFVALVGASGGGKSSVARAGLIPRVRRGLGAQTWEVLTFTPGGRPFHALAASLVVLLEPVMSETDRLVETGKLAGHLLDGTVPLADAVAAAVRKQPGTDRILAIADQWEELYTICGDERTRARFVDQLLDATASGKLSVVATLRGDFFGHALAHRSLADRLQDSVVNLGPMTRDELRRAIERPATEVGLGFESGLVERHLDDVERQPGSLPLLEFVLTELWERRRGGLLLHEVYESLGGVEGAVARRADELFDGLPPREKEQLKRVFVQLVRPGEGTEDTRRRASLTEIGEDGRALVARLADAKLLVTDRDPALGEETVEVAHEALVRNWDRLRTWMGEDREFLLWRHRLRLEIQEFERVARDREALLRGAQLAEALAWRARRASDLSAPERDFIDRSARAFRRKRATQFGSVAAAVLLIVGAALVVMVSSGEARNQARRAWVGTVVNAATNVEDPTLAALLLVELRGEPEPPGGVLAARRVAEAALSEVVLAGHEDDVYAVAFSPDGQRVGTASFDGTARIWRADGSGEPVVLSGHEGSVMAIAFSPDGQRVATASTDGTARVWPAEGSGEPVIIKGDTAWVLDVSFSPDGLRLATASTDGTARIWHADGSGEPVILYGHGDSVIRITFSPDGQRLATVSRDGTARIWQADGADEPVILHGHEGSVSAIAFSPDWQRVATGERDGTARIWRADGTDEAVILRGHEGPVRVAFSPDGQQLGTAGWDGTARLWRVAGDGEPIILRGHEGPVIDIAFNQDGTRVATAGLFDHRLRIWRAHGSAEPVILRHDERVVAVAFSPDGRQLATGSEAGTARIWRADGSGAAVVLRGHEDDVYAVAFSPDGQRVATAGGDSTARIWRADVSEEPVILRHDDRVAAVAFSPDGRQLATGGEDGTARIWRADGSGEPVVLRGHARTVAGIAFSPNGQQVATTAAGTVRIWHADGSEEPVLLRQDDWVAAVTFSPSGRRVITTGSVGTVTIWRLLRLFRRRFPIMEDRLPGATDGSVVAVSPEGQRVATKYGRTAPIGSGAPVIWRADGSGEPVILRGHEGGVNAVAFSPDGRRVATSDDGTARIWRITWDALLEYLNESTTACLTEEQRQRFLGETEATARARHISCERSYGREPGES